MKCINCNKEFEPTRADAKYCSDKCRVQFSRNKSVTNSRNTEPNVTDNSVDSVTDKVIIKERFEQEPELFEFTIVIGPRDDTEMIKQKKKIRTARYWYQVPISGVPHLKAGWPKKPDYMDGRQYFLWHQNAFKVSETGDPIIYNPYPKYEKLTYTGKPNFYGEKK